MTDKINLTNKFVYVGALQEAKIDIYSTHIKIKFSLENINHHVLTIYETISKRYNQDRYDAILSLLPQLNCRVDGWVYADNRQYYKLPQGEPSRLFVSGNISVYHNRVFFNMCYCQLIENMSDLSTISLSGVWIDNRRFMNVLYDSPRVFNIPSPNIWQDNAIYNLQLTYSCGYDIVDGVVKDGEKSELSLLSFTKTANKIDSESKNRLLLEWDIISE